MKKNNTSDSKATTFLEAPADLSLSRPINRRSFLAGSLVAGTTLGLGSLISPNVLANAPKKGGKLKVGFTQGATSDSTDPATFSNDFMFAYSYGVFNNLTEIAPDGRLIGELAESWESSSDAKTWTFNLRKGVNFHDGKPFTAEDVVASINHHRGDDSKSGAKPLVEDITSIKALDAHRVEMVIGTGNADFPFMFTDYHLSIHPAKGDKIDFTSMNGTGGYTVTALEPGVRALYTRNPNYWKAGRAHLDEIEIVLIADPAARINALSTGEVDLIDRPDLKTIHLLKRRPGIKIEQQTGTKHYVLPMLSDTAPFNDNNVRNALKYGINRQELVDKILKGYGTVGNDHPIGPSVPYFNTELKQREYDADKAQFFLKKAGLSSLDVQLHMSDTAWGSNTVDAGILYSETAAKAGMNIKVVREPNDGYFSNVWLKKPFCASYWGGRPTCDWMFTTAYAKGAAWNESRWDNARFNELLLSARSELDENKRREMYFEMQRLVHDEGSTVIPMFGNYVLAMNEKVKHEDKVANNWDLDGLRFMERWWVA